MRNGMRRADIATGQTANAIFGMVNFTQPLFLAKAQDSGRANIDTQFTATTGPLMDHDLNRIHPVLLTERSNSPARWIVISIGIFPRAWVAQERQGS
jgi:hypothetical protein